MSAAMFSARDIRSVMTWERAIESLRNGHLGERPSNGDIPVQDGAFSLCSQAAILPGHSTGVKVASIFPPKAQKDNPQAAEEAIFVIVDEETKSISCILDRPENGPLVRSDIKDDLFDLVQYAPKRDQKVTVFKNAAGAHQDQLVALSAAKELDATVWRERVDR